MKIAILVPICSRNQTYNSIVDIPLIKKLYPSFENTKDEEHDYTFFIGFDDDDKFYIEHNNELKHITSHIYMLSGCQSAPATAWNKLADLAYNDKTKYDYFFQVGDDVQLVKTGWTNRFISKLSDNDNIGVVGPCNLVNYYQRVNQGMDYVIENSFVHRTHMDIFGYFFYPFIKNWYCDDWMTQIYKKYFSEIQVDMECCNSIVDSRYKIEQVPLIKQYILEGSRKIYKYTNKKVFSYCVYGTNKKYCLGMVRNIEQISEIYPDFEVWIYIGNNVPVDYIKKYESYKNVKLIKHDFTGDILRTYRFFCIDNKYVNVMLSRDADSRFGERDKWCINNFLESKYKIFTIRDHYHHDWPIMAGQWGIKKIDGLSIEKSYRLHTDSCSDVNAWYGDQIFATEYIYKPYINVFVSYGTMAKQETDNILIGYPRKNIHDFCGNVVLFDKNDNEYFEFSAAI